MPLPIGEPSGITAAQPTSTQAPREDGIVGRVGQHDEAVVDELLGGAQQLGGIGQQRVLVADDLELDPVGREGLARELGGEDGIARGVAAGGVRQQLDTRRREDVEQRATSGRVDAPQGDGHELAAAGLDRRGHQLQRGEAAGAEQQTRAQRTPGDDEPLGAGHGLSGDARCLSGTGHSLPGAAHDLSGAGRYMVLDVGSHAQTSTRHDIAADAGRRELILPASR